MSKLCFSLKLYSLEETFDTLSIMSSSSTSSSFRALTVKCEPWKYFWMSRKCVADKPLRVPGTVSPCQWRNTYFGKLVLGSSTLKNAYMILEAFRSSFNSSNPSSPLDTNLRSKLFPSYPKRAQLVGLLALLTSFQASCMEAPYLFRLRLIIFVFWIFLR